MYDEYSDFSDFSSKPPQRLKLTMSLQPIFTPKLGISWSTAGNIVEPFLNTKCANYGLVDLEVRTWEVNSIVEIYQHMHTVKKNNA